MGLFGSGSGPLGSSGEAQRTYKTSAQDAAAMAAAWYQAAGVANPTQKALDWWTKQIQEDGSQPAFDNFKTGKGQDSADAFNAQTLATNAAANTAKTGLAPYQPSATQNQLPGTNYKNQMSDASRGLGLDAGLALVTAGLALPTAPAGAATTGGLGGIGGGAGSVGGAALPSSIPLQTGMSGSLSGAASSLPLQTGMSSGLGALPGASAGLGASTGSGTGGGLLSSIGSFAKNNPNAISGALQGLGGIATSGSKNALTNAQTTALQQQTSETAYDFKRRQARDAMLAPLWGSLNTNQDPFGYGKVAANPYAPKTAASPSAPAGA